MEKETKLVQSLNGLSKNKPINKIITSLQEVPNVNLNESEFGKIQMSEEIAGFRFGLFSVGSLIKNIIQPSNRTEIKYLKGLSSSIKKYGLIEPIRLAEYNNRAYMLDGHRRTACYYLNGTTLIPGVIKKATKREMMTFFIECNDPKNVKQIRKKDFLTMYLKRSDAPLPANITKDLIFIVDIFGKDFIQYMVAKKMATGAIKTCINVGMELGLKTKTQLKNFINWGIETKSIYFIKAFKRIQLNEKESGAAAKTILDSFNRNEQLNVSIG